MDDQNSPPSQQGPIRIEWSAYLPPTPPAPASPPLKTDAQEMKRVYSLLDGLKHHSEVRRIAEEFLTRNVSHLSSIHPVIMPLVRPMRYRWRERQVAAWILGRAHLDKEYRSEVVTDLIQLLERKVDLDFSERVKRAFWRTLPWAAIVGIPVSIDQEAAYPLVFFMMIFSLYPLVFPGSYFYDRITGSHIEAEAATSLGQLRATESLDVLVAATQASGRRRRKYAHRVREAAMAALPSVLETLTPDYYGQISSETMQGLCRMLTIGDETLAVAVLNAFAHIGNSQTIPPVEKLAGGGGRAGKEPRVQQAAQRCLPLIQLRVARENDPHYLLRASTTPPTPSDQLLRPTQEAVPIDPMEMLRASADPNWKGSSEEVTLVVQILEHLQQVGDSRAIPYVEQIAATPTADARILAAAQACLPVLKAHAELERYSPSQANLLNIQTQR